MTTSFAIATTALCLFACLVHELGHAAAAQACGLPWNLRLGWFGPCVRVQGRFVWWENALVAMGGPAASTVGWAVLRHLGLPICGIVAGLIGWGNLLPVPKADMWNLIQAWRMRKAK